MPLVALTAAEVLRKPTVKYNAADGTKRSYGAKAIAMAVRPSTPSAPTGVAAPTGGSIPITTSTSYRITTYTPSGLTESLPSTAVLVATTTNNSTVTLTIPPLAGSYASIYGRTSGTELYLGTVSLDTTATFVDTGATTPAGAMPSGAIPSGTVVLRYPNYPWIGAPRPRSRTVLAEPATTIGEAGKYEYRRV
jgi:hypothetical protein